MEANNHSFFKLFEGETAKQLIDLSEARLFPNKTILFNEGDLPEYIYLIIHGRVDLDKKVSPNTFLPIAVLEDDAYFGEFGVIDGTGRSARAITRGDVEAAVIPRKDFLSVVLDNPGHTSIGLMRHIIANVRNIDKLWLEEVLREEKISMIGSMTNSILHDIKGPLTIIKMAGQLLGDGHGDSETEEYCGIIMSQIDRMQSMAQEVLSFSRGETNLDKTPTNVKAMMENFRQTNEEYVQKAGVKFTAEAPDLIIELDEDKVERALLNMLRNAVESMQKQNDGEIQLTVQEFSDHIEIMLKDNGPGIPDEIQDRLFEPFVSHGKQGGTGLGMSICKGVVDAHQGRLTFETGDGGTTFYIHLPRTHLAAKRCTADTATV
ncbi:MAG: ATP-binding protein [Lentisphaeria bacterium]|jgi:signal transduction histidine kinase|nr:ATP-binding protein [Lentisphaeria bacterium]